jgi:O-antigen/teichoic acid export membrane protein
VIETSVTRSQVVLMAGYGVRLLLAFGITAVVGRATDPDAFGFFTLVGTIFLLAHYLFDVGTAGVVVREIARQPDRERRLLESMMGWRRLSGSALAAPLFVWALFEPHPQRRMVLLACAVALPLMASGALTPLFVVRQRQEALEVTKVLGQGFVLLGGAVFWAAGVAGPFYGLLVAARALLNAASVRLLAIRRLGYRPRARLRGQGLPVFLRMAVITAAAILVQAAYFHVDVFLVLALRGEAELGAYSAAFRPVSPLLTLPGLFMFPMLPLLSAAARADRRSYSAQVGGAAALLLGVGALAGVIGALLAPEALRVLYGDRYLGGELDASTSLRWMALALAVAFPGAAFNIALLADGRERLLLRVSLLGLLVNVVGNLALLPAYGFSAAAFTTALTGLVVAFVSFLAVRASCETRTFGPGALVAVAPAALVATLLWHVEGPTWLRLACAAVLGAGASGVLYALPATRRLRRSLAMRSAEIGHG